MFSMKDRPKENCGRKEKLNITVTSPWLGNISRGRNFILRVRYVSVVLDQGWCWKMETGGRRNEQAEDAVSSIKKEETLGI